MTLDWMPWFISNRIRQGSYASTVCFSWKTTVKFTSV